MIRRVELLAALLLSCTVMAAGCGRAPAIGPDKEVFTTIDALYTAVSMKDAGQLERNATSLNRFHEAGRLPDGAHEALAAIVFEAKGGEWEPARQKLRDFMLDQGPQRER
ncbi:hypothetical protein EP7_000516 [Isosphaeraceae bacterium EP7]